MNNNPKILIVGAGAIGAFYGSKLSQSGAEVSVICRSDYDYVKNHGFTIKSHWEQPEYKFLPNQVLRDFQSYKDDADFIIIATKVLDPNLTTDLLKTNLRKKSAIVLLQNGIHIEKKVADSFPENEIISALAFICVSRVKPGYIHHQDYGRLVIGNYPNSISTKTELLANLWQKSQVPCETSNSILKQRWKKLVWNAAFNPISVLSGSKNTEEILKNSATEDLVRNVMHEVCTLAKADDCKLEEEIVEKNIADTKEMKPYKTSMLLDFEAKREMEIEAILGNAIRFAKQKNISIPHLSSLYGLLCCYKN
ncbi:MAG: 2-dehydropantoate 2-reductase [Pelagibacterales bacterium]|nr:2-dehydropantoate 2-reductase [Pelagibacterales bacterium]